MAFGHPSLNTPISSGLRDKKRVTRASTWTCHVFFSDTAMAWNIHSSLCVFPVKNSSKSPFSAFSIPFAQAFQVQIFWIPKQLIFLSSDETWLPSKSFLSLPKPSLRTNPSSKQRTRLPYRPGEEIVQRGFALGSIRKTTRSVTGAAHTPSPMPHSLFCSQ